MYRAALSLSLGLNLLLFSFSIAQYSLRVASTYCFDSPGQDTISIPGGRIETENLRITRNGLELRLNSEYRLVEEDSVLELASPIFAKDSLCVYVYRSPLIPNPWIRLYRRQDIPIWQEQVSPLLDLDYKSLATEPNSEYHIDYGGSQSLLLSIGGGGSVYQQSLKVQLSGQIEKNVWLEGKLSDENLPVQPEGNTATLKDLDELYIKVYGSQYSLLLGDYSIAYGESGWDYYSAKVLGASGYYSSNYGKIDINISPQSRGRFHSYSFQGKDGQQKGYYLQGKQGETFIVVLAGSERVWKNGTLLGRGNEYTIDYGEGRIDFLNSSIVSSENTFTVEFQYTELDYQKGFYSAAGQGKLGENWIWKLRSAIEQEDAENPQSFVLGTAEEKLFRSIGDSLYLLNARINQDTSLSFRSGLIPAQRKSSSSIELNWQKDLDRFARLQNEVSYHDFNQYSSLDDKDNVGTQFRFTGAEKIGDFLSKGSWGVNTFEWELISRSENYHFFQSGLEPRAYNEKWNLISSEAEQDYQQASVILGYQPWALFQLGTEAGYARAYLHPNPMNPLLNNEIHNSMRSRAYGRIGALGDNSRYLLLETESKLGKTPWRRDNYRQHVIGQYQKGTITPLFEWTGNEWLTVVENQGLAHSRKREAKLNLETQPLGTWSKLNLGVSRWWQASNFNATLSSPVDSLDRIETSAKLELFSMGAWSSDIFVSRQLKREWPLSVYLSPEISQSILSRYWLTEWTERYDRSNEGVEWMGRMSYSRSEDYPLIAVYDTVPKGLGDYRYDSLLNAYFPDPSQGDLILLGMRRDTVVNQLAFQDRQLETRFDLDPGLWDFVPSGILRDLRGAIEIQLSQQDSSNRIEIIPDWKDAALLGSLGGRSHIRPSLAWTLPKKLGLTETIWNRSFKKTYGSQAYSEKNIRWENRYQVTIQDKNEFQIIESTESSRRQSLTGFEGASNRNVFSLGSEFSRRLRFALLMRLGLSFNQVDGDIESSQASLSKEEFNEWVPFGELQKSFSSAGIASLRYTLHWIDPKNGLIDPSYYVGGGYQSGITQLLDLSSNFQTTQNLFFHLSYNLRKDPGKGELSQRMSAEARAVF